MYFLTASMSNFLSSSFFSYLDFYVYEFLL